MFKKYDAYKDSGVAWIGEIPSDWVCKKHKFLASFNKGKNPKDFIEKNGDGLYPYLSIESLRNNTNNGFCRLEKGMYLIKDMQPLLIWDGSNAGEFILGREGILSSTMAALTLNYPLNKNYYWYLCCCMEIELRKSTNGMGIPHVNGNELKDLYLPIPKYEEQLKIADFLYKKTSEIDQAIAIKEQQIALLNERKQIVIQKAVTQGLNPNVAIKDSGVEWIEKIPEHWDIRANRTIFKERNEQGIDGLPLLSVSIHSGVSNEEISEEDNVRGRVKIEDKSKYILVEKGDIAFNMMRAWQGGIGAVSVDGMVSPAYIVAKPNKLINSEFFEYQYRCPEFIQQMDRYSKGITDFRKRLYWDGFKQLVTIVPPIDEQQGIINYIKKVDEQTAFAIDVKKQQIEKLKEYKTTLINDAVTGKIKVA